MVYNPATGQLTSKTKGGVTTSYGYDTQGRTLTITNANTSGNTSTVSYSYDAAGNKLTQTTWPTLYNVGTPNATLGYKYDADERLYQVYGTSGTLSAAYSYYPTGNLWTLTRSNGAGITTTYTYDHLNRLTDVLNKNSGGTVVSEYNYQLLASGKRHIVTEYGANDVVNNNITYTYDVDSRLTEENGTLTGDIVYKLDNVGNRLFKYINGPQVQSFTYDADDRVTNTGYSYDANGNVKSDGVNNYAWDWDNKMSASQPVAGGATMSYTYNADGLRVQQINSTGSANYTIDPDAGYGDVVINLQLNSVASLL